MKIHGTTKGGALSKKDFGVAFSAAAAGPLTYTWSACDSTGDMSLNYNLFIGARLKNGNTLIDKTITVITCNLKNPSSITGTSVLKCYATDGTLKATSDTVANSTIGTGYQTVTFDNFSWAVVVEDYFLISPSTGSSMKIFASLEDCNADTNIMENTSDIADYDFIGTATYS